jgi:hypothetical protein
MVLLFVLPGNKRTGREVMVMATIETPHCFWCGEDGTLEVPDQDAVLAQRYAHGYRGLGHIQDAFPNMSPEDREQIKTGIHSKCWEAIMSDEDDDE